MSIETAKIIRTALDLVKPQFRLPLHHGYHGIQHWVRVWSNAEMLCKYYSTDPTVPCWFAFLHDSQRYNEDCDREHGPRAASFMYQHWRAGSIELTQDQMDTLYHAMAEHSDGETRGFTTERICWDADRLDLGRCGIMPDANRLCTGYARQPEVIREAWLRSTVHRPQASLKIN